MAQAQDRPANSVRDLDRGSSAACVPLCHGSLLAAGTDDFFASHPDYG